MSTYGQTFYFRSGMHWIRSTVLRQSRGHIFKNFSGGSPPDPIRLNSNSPLPWPYHCFPFQFMSLYTKTLSSPRYSLMSTHSLTLVTCVFCSALFDELPPPLHLPSGASVNYVFLLTLNFTTFAIATLWYYFDQFVFIS